MEIKKEDLEKRYQALTDDEILEIYKSGGLTDIASKVLVGELRRRRLTDHMWTCEKCGEKHVDTFDSCWKCLTPKQKGPRRQRQAKATSDKGRNSGKGTSRQEDTQTLIFSCVTCSTNLRFHLPLMEGLYTCGSCRTGYRAVKATDSPLVFLVLAQPQRNQTHSSSTLNRPHREVTPQVRTALKIFALDETATFDQVRQAYREFVKAYHPDKVSHLGADLRELAETKTKEFNSAFKVLETFYST